MVVLIYFRVDMRYNLIALSIAFASLTLSLGCAEDRPISPHVVPKMDATPITSAILEDTSAFVPGVALSDSSRAFDFSSSTLFQSGDYDDIQIGFTAELFRLPSALSIYNPATSSWTNIEGAVAASGGYYCLDRCITYFRRLTSEISNAKPRSGRRRAKPRSRRARR